MGSDGHLVVVGGSPRLVDQALDRIEQLESRWSRFRPSSEICRLNARAGQPVRVSPDTVELVERATVAWRLSGGAFDPTVLGPMLRAGYDRTFSELGDRRAADRLAHDRQVDEPADQAAAMPALDPARLGLGAADIRVEGDLVTLPYGIGFDPGGIGKGLAADLVVADLLAAGAAGACVNLGGDVRVAGVGPAVAGRAGSSDPTDADVTACWTVGVWHPRRRPPLVRIGLAGGAVATSTTLLRRWSAPSPDGTGSHERHHLIDPRSGLPSDTDLELATVVAAEAWVAEVLAKSVILRGSAHPFDTVDATAAQALAVDRLGRVLVTDGLAAYLGDHPAPIHLSAPDPLLWPGASRQPSEPSLQEAS
jgi:FAD:protein FMN transferase